MCLKETIINNKLSLVVSCVISIAIFKNYLIPGTVVLLRLWEVIKVWSKPYKKENIENRIRRYAKMFMVIMSFIMYLLSWKNFNFILFLYTFSLSMSLHIIMMDMIKLNLNKNEYNMVY